MSFGQVTSFLMIAMWVAALPTFSRAQSGTEVPRGLSGIPVTQVAQLRPGKAITNTIGIKLIRIPAGEFTMGRTEIPDESIRYNDLPRRRVRITRPFFLGATEVTQGQWEALMQSRPWSEQRHVMEGADYPATYVSWDDARAFCNRLSAVEGREYRLPTEAEWEYACRAGTTMVYSSGDDSSELGSYAWFHENTYDVGEKHAHRVGQKRPNPWYLYDMHGNVWEWCRDRYRSGYDRNSPMDNPTGPSSGTKRVVRGGGWMMYAVHCRSANRRGHTPDSRSFQFGFRVVHVPAE